MRQSFTKPFKKRVPSLILLVVFLACFQGAFAQSVRVSGKVTAADDGSPIPGVNVLIKGTAVGTTTDGSGAFVLDVQGPSSATLVFSFIGYASQEVAVSSRSSIDVAMQTETTTLNEIVVVGYGTTRKADITSAVSVVNMENIGDVPTASVSRLLLGQAAGVQVRQTSGTPGAEMEVTIRGIGSLGAGSQPLYVVDGFPIGTSLGQSLNPVDIESITVLKDAASTAIYGARGSNGVILITTKSAKEGQMNLTFDANYGVQNIPDSRRTKMMNGVEFAQFKQESYMDKVRYFQKREPTIDEVPLDYRYPEQT